MNFTEADGQIGRLADGENYTLTYTTSVRHGERSVGCTATISGIGQTPVVKDWDSAVYMLRLMKSGPLMPGESQAPE